ncbi:LysR family transcriptional regulator [Oceanobacillus damuensis]|uniref:LysR family transcriptional regulator n=1 Tax=Oceanobacillus damuensis TaxID=937928 RepID=UPI00082F01D0|nr:LysR family transcriptional regulator [Oceanobacillus damuensis]
MRIEQLQRLVEIADTGSISNAAEKLYTSQPNISQSIANLEKELNVKIFVRTRLGSIPTETGKLVIKKARAIVNQIKDLQNIEHDYRLTGTLTIVSIPTFVLTILPKTLNVFKKRYPDVEITVLEDGTKHAIDAIRNDKADLALASLSYLKDEEPGLNFDPLFTNKTIAYVGSDFPLVHQKSITLEEAIQFPLVIFNKNYSSNYIIRNLIERFGEPNILFSSGNSETMKKIIAESNAIGFYAEISCKTDPYVLSRKIFPIPIKDDDITLYSKHGIFTKKDIYLSTLARKFMDELRIQSMDFKLLYNLPNYSFKEHK